MTSQKKHPVQPKVTKYEKIIEAKNLVQNVPQQVTSNWSTISAGGDKLKKTALYIP